MAERYRETYHGPKGLEQAVLDLVRVGSTGHASGVRQLATRLTRGVPDGVVDPARFRDALQAALVAATTRPGLRFAGGEMPLDDAGQHQLVDVEPFPDGAGLVLDASGSAAVGELVEEWRRVDELARAGVGVSRTLLLSGPPGVGKTMTARWVAQQLGLPLVTLDLAGVVSSYLGSSGRNIRTVLDYAKSGSCVLLLDEFDALAKRRDDDADIGELKRIVNVILVELDRWPDTSLLIAATNHPQLLDEAVDRRFDRHVQLALPAVAEREQIMTELAVGTSADLAVIGLVVVLTDGMSGSDLTRLWRTARRRSVLQKQDVNAALLSELARRNRPKGPHRDILWTMLSDRLHMSTRQIGELFGVSHPTVSSAIKRVKASS